MSTHASEPHERPPLSVIVPTRDRPTMLARCLRSIRDCMGPQDELIVVDSASKDAAAVANVSDEAHARLLRLQVRGEARARNAGWRAARHELIAYLDDDAWVHPEWADAFARCFAAYPEAAFITGRLDIPPGQQPRLWISVKIDPLPARFDRSSAGLLGHAANLAVRRSVLEQCGGFDEQLGPGARFRGATEGDLFDRLLARGFVGRYEPNARGWHDQWRSKPSLLFLDHRSGIGSGARLAKLVRTDRTRARLVAPEVLWRWGLREWFKAVRHRDKFLIASVTVRLSGVVVGFCRGLFMPVHNGHFRPRTPPGTRN